MIEQELADENIEDDIENIKNETDSFADEECSALDLPSNYTQTQFSSKRYNFQDDENDYGEEQELSETEVQEPGQANQDQINLDN